MRRFSRYLLLPVALLCFIQLASAQSSFDINIGFGAIHDKANATQIDQNLNPCTPNDPAPPCVSTPALSGFMLGFGGDLMLWKKLGVGAAVSFQPGKQDYVDMSSQAAFNGLNTLVLQTRVTLYDFDGIYEPVNTKKVALKLKGGIGGANVKFYQSGSASNSVIGSQNYTQYFASSNHFQVHGGAGVQIYVSEHVFVRPEFNIHYVPNMTQQFGSNAVIEGMVWLGYSFGDRP